MRSDGSSAWGPRLPKCPGRPASADRPSGSGAAFRLIAHRIRSGTPVVAATPWPSWTSRPTCTSLASISETERSAGKPRMSGVSASFRPLATPTSSKNVGSRCNSSSRTTSIHVMSRGGCVEIGSSSKHWPCLFPQHGPGAKHKRPIRLQPWQRNLVQQYPKLLLRGLVHADGCRNLDFVTSHGRRYDYWRYTFSSASDDIRGIFTDACDALGVHWTQMNARNVSIARRADVAFLDTFIGPKS